MYMLGSGVASYFFMGAVGWQLEIMGWLPLAFKACIGIARADSLGGQLGAALSSGGGQLPPVPPPVVTPLMLGANTEESNELKRPVKRTSRTWSQKKEKLTQLEEWFNQCFYLRG